FWCIFYKFAWRDELFSIGGEEIPCEDAIGAGETVGLIKSKANCVGAADKSAAGEGKSHHERGEGSAYSTETLAWLGDCDSVVVEWNPGGAVDLHAALIGIPQAMDLQPERLHRFSLGGQERDGPAYRLASCTQDLDR